MLSRTELAEQVWDMSFDTEANMVEVAIRRLRGKLDAPFERSLLYTVRGMGYCSRCAPNEQGRPFARTLDGSAQPEELQPLIAQFNALLGRLAQSYEQLEGFNADVAHELCTPLATLVSSTELAMRRPRGADDLRDMLGSNLEELHRIASIVQDMLFLSQADRGSAARRAATPSLAALVGTVAEYHEAALEKAGLRLDIVGDASGEFDIQLLRRALSNLVGNVTQYAKRATAVRVDIDMPVAGEVRIAVSNRGLTIDPRDLPRLFDRFFRSEHSRSGAAQHHGLGLSIVAASARMHGGRPFAASVDGLNTIGITLASSETR